VKNIDGETALDEAVKGNKTSAALYLSWLGAECEEENRKYREVTLQTWIEAGCQEDAQYWAVASNKLNALKRLVKRDSVRLDREKLLQVAKIFNSEAAVSKVIDKVNKNTLLTLLTDQKYTDVEVICHGKSFPCHKVILAAHSNVFQSIIDSKERDGQELKVEIPECANVGVAEQFIKFFYTEKLENDFLEANLVLLLYLSDFFNMEHLHGAVEEKMVSKLSRETVKQFLVAGHKYHGEEIKDNAMKFLADNKGVWKENKEEWKDCIDRSLL